MLLFDEAENVNTEVVVRIWGQASRKVRRRERDEVTPEPLVGRRPGDDLVDHERRPADDVEVPTGPALAVVSKTGKKSGTPIRASSPCLIGPMFWPVLTPYH